MKYFIDPENNKAAYIQLYEQLRNDITGGLYSFGAKLPSKRLLAEESGVSVITAEHAYEILCDEGYTEAKKRSGYYVIYKHDDFWISDGRPVAENIFEENVAGTPLPDSCLPFPVMAKTMRKVLADRGDAVLKKSPNHGCIELRSAVSAYLARSNGIIAGPDQIIIGSGAEYLYNLIVQLLGKNSVFALEDPSYEKIKKVYEANGVKCEMLTLGEDGIISSELKKTRATVLHITPFNSYPSHVTATASKRNEYIRWAIKRNGYIIEDNYDSELTVSTKHEDAVYSLSDNATVIYLNTFSKTVAPSIRAGYMVLPEKLLEKFEKTLGFYSCTVPVFEQYVLAELINSGDFERHINKVRRTRRKQKK
jgi:GntR family transcriptional regulator/MocR family aminotransferase